MTKQQRALRIASQLFATTPLRELFAFPPTIAFAAFVGKSQSIETCTEILIA